MYGRPSNVATERICVHLGSLSPCRAIGLILNIFYVQVYRRIRQHRIRKQSILRSRNVEVAYDDIESKHDKHTWPCGAVDMHSALIMHVAPIHLKWQLLELIPRVWWPWVMNVPVKYGWFRGPGSRSTRPTSRLLLASDSIPIFKYSENILSQRQHNNVFWYTRYILGWWVGVS